MSGVSGIGFVQSVLMLRTDSAFFDRYLISFMECCPPMSLIFLTKNQNRHI